MSIQDVWLSKITGLAFNLNALLDQGERVDPSIVRQQARDQTVLPWLAGTYPQVDQSLLTERDEAEIEDLFFNLENAVSARRKFGVEKDGLCLLVAWCLEAIQQRYPVGS